MRNAMSIDVEDWFHPEALRGVVQPGDWDQLAPRAGRNVERLLRLFDAAQVRATFFVLGWVAEREPDLVPRLAAEGHEVASHGYAHRMITQQEPAEFAADLRRSLQVLRAQSGQRVLGYRAPSFSVVRDTLWALDELLEQGLSYDASIFPVHHDRYGIPGAPRAPYRVRARGERELWELPPVTWRVVGRNFPAAGGGYLRLLPYAYTAHALRAMNAQGVPGTVYSHPWEYDPEQPRLPLGGLQALRHYGRLASTEAKLVRLLREFRFTTCAEVLDTVRGHRAADALPVVALAEAVPAGNREGT
jgi:polysaccharide deacetylase family protein (PEP-CTERM system associated)